jgi:hypothetical protein
MPRKLQDPHSRIFLSVLRTFQGSVRITSHKAGDDDETEVIQYCCISLYHIVFVLFSDSWDQRPFTD